MQVWFKLDKVNYYIKKSHRVTDIFVCSEKGDLFKSTSNVKRVLLSSILRNLVFYFRME